MSVDTLLEARLPGRLAMIPAFNDNYIWAIRSPDGGAALVVDPGDAAAVRRWLGETGCRLCAVLVTHHHFDHTGGLAGLCDDGMPVFGPRHENIAGVNRPVGDGAQVDLPALGLSLRVLEVPGHTAGHIAFTGDLDGQPLLFCGDTLFSAGCGRLFEGTPAEMHASLARLAALPADSLVCCAHEYTLGNLRFAAAVEPGNEAIARFTAWARARRDAGLPTLPGTLARELQVNPFLRTGCAEVRAAVAAHEGVPLDDGAATFAALRRWKDGFR